jgi:putative phosphoribosyl transferase
MKAHQEAVQIPAGNIGLEGNLTIPSNAAGLIIFAHGSGSSRHSPRNRYVAEILQEAGLATLLMDLLTQSEEVVDVQTAQLRFNIGLLADRLVHAADWACRTGETRELPVGLFGSSTGAAAALIAAAERPTLVRAVVSRGGRPDLAALALPYVQAPTLLIVGGDDVPVIGMNREAMSQMKTETRLEIVPNASHLFEEHGALEQVARLASRWFAEQLARVSEKVAAC